MIYPALLTGDPKIAHQQIETIKNCSGAKVIQIDVIDGLYADIATITPSDLQSIDWGALKCDFHLMINEPLDGVLEAVEYQDHLPIRAIISQLEHMSSQLAYLEEVKAHNWQAGFSLDYGTPIEAIDDESWQFVDIVQIMGNTAGSQGQKLHPQTLPMLQEVSNKLQELDHPVELLVDIGVNEQTIVQLAEVGAKGFVVGSSLWQADDVCRKFDQLSKLATIQM